MPPRSLSASRLLLAAALLAAPALAAHAQSRGARLGLDIGTFRYSPDASLAEVYLSVGAKSLRYTRTAEGRFDAAVPVRVTMTPIRSAAPAGASAAPVFDRTVDFRFSVADTSALQPGQVLTEQVRAALPPGEYQVQAAVAASPVSVSVQAQKDLVLPAYGAAAPSISSVQLARRIVRAQSNEDAFAKSGMVVQPYPDALFGGDLSRVTYYAEVYGLPGAEYTMLAYLSDSSRPMPIDGTETRTTRPVQPVDVVFGAVDVGTLPTGEYTLHLAALNASNEAVAEQTKRFYVLNPDVAQPERSVAMAEDDEILYRAMGEEELRLNVDHARVIANSREQQLISGVRSDDDRRALLIRFWRDRNTASPAGDARRQFYSRLARVNDQYRHGGRPGYLTDRGRVYLIYGPPTGIDRQSFNSDSAPFERWDYNNIPGQGRSMFVFVDRFKSGNMELIHSNVVGEVSLPNWEQELIDR